jgi:hypothetical protein
LLLYRDWLPRSAVELFGWACMAFVFGSTISLSFADFQDGGVRGSRGFSRNGLLVAFRQEQRSSKPAFTARGHA